MNKKLFFASIISIVLGASLGISFLLIPSYVNENGILKEPWYLVESGFSFVIIRGLLMFFAIGGYLCHYFENKIHK
ncbi:DUF3955 domain-containing protein [Staphylococcus saprophyticus]|uniref:DUF3955 domain-containing protein n=2 Tax=Staphylococcus saprophyticus TaxID=29385 RepID=UPI000E08545B|nr:DUF3955 domain-containing protein [Staphylococcus saprophyticus]MDT3918367.1 DUF3955 domain-containing protein [Staphylococcus saprophyticus]MDT3967381.1 DUF3955 domain-containing protein [Staphylococcus saprophyticus]MDT3972878.1 DUF3955 domain-containing protein [Staphylococcus saprophyticus]MDT3979095.1 DUF3955 domain-containing protein [Staphylococcus saprophyticus]MDT3985125.1 DUF3955 domain-containing protein [Staphylococcus saprophyticus]